MKHILIIGAKSDIALELARVYAQNGYCLFLAGRNMSTLKPIASDLSIRHQVEVKLLELDITNYKIHQSFFSKLNPKPIGVVMVVGYMAEQSLCETEWKQTFSTVSVNYVGPISFLNIVAQDFEQSSKSDKLSRFIVGISSVAGDRGRKTNYIYGSSKAGFSAYLSGLRNRLADNNVQVLTVKPGFVATKMTEGMDLPKLLLAQPEQVAQDIFCAQQKGKDVLYTKKIWWLVMLIIKYIPEKIFKRMSI